MHGMWFLSLGVICLLQLPVSAEPRPDFSLHVPLYGSSRVSGAITETRLTVSDINDNLYTRLESNYSGLQDLLELCQEVGETVADLLGGVLSPLATLVPSDDSHENELFETVSVAVGEVQSFINEPLLVIRNKVEDLVGMPLPAQLQDVFGRIAGGLDELSFALDSLKAVIDSLHSPHNGEGRMSEMCAPKNVPPQLVYRVVYAVRNLRAYLPVVTYILTTTVQNIATADRFIVRLSKEAQEVQKPSQYVDLMNVGAVAVGNSVNSGVRSVVTAFGTVAAAVSQLSHIQTLAAFSSVREVQSSFGSTFDQLATAVPQFMSSLLGIGGQLQVVLTPDMSTPTVSNTEVVHSLVVTLIAGGPYARYCFHKYSELLFGLANTGLTGVEACVNRELMRLQHLRAALLLHVEMLMYDQEDIVGELTACNTLSSADAREACVAMLAQVYADIASNFRTKFNNLYSTGRSEALASKHRLTACVRLLPFQIVDGTASDLNAMILQCATNGPVEEK